MGRMIDIQANDGGKFSAYLAEPASGKGPGLIVIQEIFGVNEPMRTLCDQYAEQGYVAACPDLFWRQEPGIQLTDKEQAHWDRAFELYKGFDVDVGIKDIAATIGALHDLDSVTGPVGAVGYCLGGLLAYLTATRTDVDAAVGYYGVGIDGYLDEAETIAGHLMLHVAEEDGFVDKAVQQRMHDALDLLPNIEIHDYAGADHAFARPDGTHFSAKAAELANSRTRAFFKAWLRTG